jgi:hypothetical protein
MDVTAPFKSEVLRPITTWVIPGFVAIAPYVVVVGFYVPEAKRFCEAHPSAATVFMLICVLAAGLILENFGASIETALWDRLLDRKYANHLENWDRYLKLRLRDEIIAQRYLKTLVPRMKFELSMAPALFIFWLGLLWLNLIYRVWTVHGFTFLSALLVLGAFYFLRTSYTSAKVLSRIRGLILECIAEDQSSMQPRET